MRDDQQSVHCHGIISDVRELSYDPRHEVEVTRTLFRGNANAR